MLFLQGDRDELAHVDLLRPVIAGLGERATLTLIQGADHAFKLPARSKRSTAQVYADLAQLLRAWLTPKLRK